MLYKQLFIDTRLPIHCAIILFQYFNIFQYGVSIRNIIIHRQIQSSYLWRYLSRLQ